MTFSHKCYLPVTKKMEKIDCSFNSPKTTFLAIFANFGQLWMVVYTAMIKFFDFFKIYRMGLGSILFLQKSYSTKTDGGGEVSSPPPNVE